jgi:aryl-alcohol dehydrogenase-like predicted oxidoreductase
MHYRRLGRTGMMVSEIGFGGLPIGGLRWGSVEDEDSLAALERAFDLGINLYDTADIYGRGHSEELIGQAFASRRPNVVIATKAGMDFYAGEPAKQNFAPAYIRGALERSLERLRTDYVDVLQLHNPPQKLARDDGVWETLADLKREGKVRFFGISARTVNDAAAYLKAAARDGPPGRYGDTLQVAFNLLEQEAAAKGIFVEAYRQELGVISRVPLASGMLTGKYSGDHYFPPTDFRSMWSPGRIKETARRVEALRFLVKPPVESMTQAALAFVLSQEAVSTVITGAKTEAQVEENARAPEAAPLPQEDLRRAQALWEGGFAQPLARSTRCATDSLPSRPQGAAPRRIRPQGTSRDREIATDGDHPRAAPLRVFAFG